MDDAATTASSSQASSPDVASRLHGGSWFADHDKVDLTESEAGALEEIAVNIFFQNVGISAHHTRPDRFDPKTDNLPKRIYFYVKTVQSARCQRLARLRTPGAPVLTGASQTRALANHRLPGAIANHRLPHPCLAETGVPFPFPPQMKRYLHRTSVVKGHENAGPVFCLRPSPQTIVGLEPFMLKGGRARVGQLQLELVVPSTKTINPRLRPTSLTFDPLNSWTLHASSTSPLPRVIVPVQLRHRIRPPLSKARAGTIRAAKHQQQQQQQSDSSTADATKPDAGAASSSAAAAAAAAAGDDEDDDSDEDDVEGTVSGLSMRVYVLPFRNSDPLEVLCFFVRRWWRIANGWTTDRQGHRWEDRRIVYDPRKPSGMPASQLALQQKRKRAAARARRNKAQVPMLGSPFATVDTRSKTHVFPRLAVALTSRSRLEPHLLSPPREPPDPLLSPKQPCLSPKSQNISPPGTMAQPRTASRRPSAMSSASASSPSSAGGGSRRPSTSSQSSAGASPARKAKGGFGGISRRKSNQLTTPPPMRNPSAIVRPSAGNVRV